MQQPTPPATPVLTPDQLPVAPVQDNQGGFALSPEMERLRAGRLRRNKFSNIADALGGIGLSLSALGKGQTITENPFTAKIEARRREQEAYESFTGSEALADLPLEQQREVVSALETFGVEAAAGILSRHRQTNAQQAFQIDRDEAGFANDKELALLRAQGAGGGLQQPYANYYTEDGVRFGVKWDGSGVVRLGSETDGSTGWIPLGTDSGFPPEVANTANAIGLFDKKAAGQLVADYAKNKILPETIKVGGSLVQNIGGEYVSVYGENENGIQVVSNANGIFTFDKNNPEAGLTTQREFSKDGAPPAPLIGDDKVLYGLDDATLPAANRYLENFPEDAANFLRDRAKNAASNLKGTGESGGVKLSQGQEYWQLNPDTGEFEKKIANKDNEKPFYTPPTDIQAVLDEYAIPSGNFKLMDQQAGATAAGVAIRHAKKLEADRKAAGYIRVSHGKGEFGAFLPNNRYINTTDGSQTLTMQFEDGNSRTVHYLPKGTEAYKSEKTKINSNRGILHAATNLASNIDNDAFSVKGAVWGKFGSLAPKDVKNTLANVKQLYSKIYLTGFQELKGGGHITDTEGQIAAAAYAVLEGKLDPETFKENMAILHAITSRVVKRQEAALADQSTKIEKFDGKTYETTQEGLYDTIDDVNNPAFQSELAASRSTLFGENPDNRQVDGDGENSGYVVDEDRNNIINNRVVKP